MSNPSACIEVTDTVADWWNSRGREEREGIAQAQGFPAALALLPFQAFSPSKQTAIVEFWSERIY